METIAQCGVAGHSVKPGALARVAGADRAPSWTTLRRVTRTCEEGRPVGVPRRAPALLHCIGLALAVASTVALGQQIPGYPNLDAYDPREVGMLPRYCQFTQRFRLAVPGGNNPDEIKRWQQYMGGEVFEHMHHYCWGMMKTNRAMLLARDGDVRTHYLAEAIGEFDYVLKRIPPDFVLLPEILTKRGENLIRLGKAPIGLLDLERAAEVKPDYWPAFAQLGDYYRSTGDRAKAREWLERGLRGAPGATALTRRLAELEAAKPAARGEPKRAPQPAAGG